MTDLITAIDQGTTGSTVLLLNRSVEVVAAVNVEFPNHYPQPGWVEHDVSEIWDSILRAAEGALQQLSAKGAEHNIVAIGITNQRETSLFWDRNTGEPIHRALVWQDPEDCGAVHRAERCRSRVAVSRQNRAGAGPYFSGTKAAWLLDNVPGARARAERGSCFLAPLTAGLPGNSTGAHVTDPSNASRTLLFNLHTMDWDDELLQILGVPRACLPRIVDNAEVVGHTTGIPFVADGTPVAGLAGDQQSALFGQACFAVGEAKCTYGTGAFLLMNRATPVPSSNGLLTTVAWRLNGQTTYALEGSAFIAGAAVQWLRDGLQIISSAAEVEALAETVEDTNGITFVPAFAGLGAPHWRPEARGVVWNHRRCYQGSSCTRCA